MKRLEKAELALLVWGDWYSIIAVRDYREALIDQGPNDEDAADYSQYVVPCGDAGELLKAYEAFKSFRRGIRINKSGPEWRVTAQTADGYSNDGPFIALEVDSDAISGSISEAARKATEILRAALK